MSRVPPRRLPREGCASPLASIEPLNLGTLRLHGRCAAVRRRALWSRGPRSRSEPPSRLRRRRFAGLCRGPLRPCPPTARPCLCGQWEKARSGGGRDSSRAPAGARRAARHGDLSRGCAAALHECSRWRDQLRSLSRGVAERPHRAAVARLASRRAARSDHDWAYAGETPVSVSGRSRIARERVVSHGMAEKGRSRTFRSPPGGTGRF